jgi:CRISPR system Cascade subunit CasA
LATACPPADYNAWRKWWRQPPNRDELAAAFAPYARAFVLDDDGPRFMQDEADLGGKAIPASQLLIEAPGNNTERLNKDLFEKRGRVPAMSRGVAAIALYTLQTYAPAGGQGHRTSIRGGGPLTTLVIPTEKPNEPTPLWQQLWLNVISPSREASGPAPCDASVFPWLGSTRTSERDRATTPQDMHPAQVYWGMPRRIRLDFDENQNNEHCALSENRDTIFVRTYRIKNHGTKYEACQHPLTPYYKPKKDGSEWLPTHARPGGIGYRQWVALVQERDASRPAAVVTRAKERLVDETGPAASRRARLLASGYDMDNMKARGFAESEMPLHLLSGEGRGKFEDVCRNLVASAAEVAGVLVVSVRAALFSQGSSVKTDRDLFVNLRERFFLETEDFFFSTIDEAASVLDAGGNSEALGDKAARDWLARLHSVALRLFDEVAPLDTDAVKNIARLVEARRNLVFALTGFGKRGVALFEILQLSPPETKARSGRKEAA